MENEEITQTPQQVENTPEASSPAVDRPSEETATDPPTAEEPDVDLDALIEEAEHRGYLRGRNEAIGQVKRRLAQWEVPRVDEPRHPTQSTPTILANLPTSIWDR